MDGVLCFAHVQGFLAFWLLASACVFCGQIIENCTVTDVETRTNDFGSQQVCAVHTNMGVIHTQCVLNCAGAWAPRLGEMAGVAVPLVPMRHAYVVTEHIDGIRNCPNVRDHDLSLYLKLQGDGLSIGGYEYNPMFIDDVSQQLLVAHCLLVMV